MQKKLLTRLGLAAFGLSAAILLARVVLLEGLLRPVRVVSGSMAETLIGEHYQLQCAECGFPFRCDRVPPPLDTHAVCPNCGFRENPVADEQMRHGERVLIDHSCDGSVPPRWTMVAFASPDAPGELAVKRVVGLPGERIAIRDGELLIDGRIVRKSLAQQRELAVLVHDDGFRTLASAGLPPRWQGDAAGTRWRASGGGFSFAPASDNRAAADTSAGDDSPQAADWLTYRHWRCVASPLPRTEEAPVRDNYGYNQGISRQLHVVTDLMLVCRLQVSGGGALTLRGNTGRDVLEAAIHPADGRLELLRNGKRETSVPWPRRLNGQKLEVVFSLFDQQATLAADGELLLERRIEPAERPLAPTSRPFALGARGVQVAVERLQVFRDLYYLAPHGFGVPWERQRPLGRDELFVLGDNVPISHDSRVWPKALKRDALAGVVAPYR